MYDQELYPVPSEQDRQYSDKEETVFLNQVEKDKNILEKLSPSPKPNGESPWDY